MKEAIEGVLQSMHAERRYAQAQVVHAWPTLMGPSVAKRTSRLFVSDRKLFVSITSAPLRKELSMSRGQIAALLNAEVGQQVIDDVVFQ